MLKVDSVAYGFLFGVYPALVAECFGVHGLSQNWGCMILAPIVFGNIFNLAYGTYNEKPQTSYQILISAAQVVFMTLIPIYCLMGVGIALMGDFAIMLHTTLLSAPVLSE